MERLASMSNPTRKSIGVIGLGIIGRAIAAHLRRKGFSVFVWNRSPQPVPNFVGSLGELAGICNYIQIFVSDDEALLQTVEQLSESLTPRDRKSTRLNSSHQIISYAVFCLKKK